jgi:regulator of nonsense transcripts 1
MVKCFNLETKLVPGDELKIIDPNNGKSYTGFILRVELDDEVLLELEKSNVNLTDGPYSVEFVWRGTSFKRMLDGLYSFVNDENSVSSYIYYKLLGHNTDDKRFNYNIPKDLAVKGLPELNYFQTLGIKKALQSPLFLIQGPPGTGKTVTSAAIVYHLSQLKVGKILVCTPSNIAADQLSEKIAKTGLNVVRLCAKSRESISTKVEDLSLHKKIKNLPPKEYKRLFELMKLKEENGEIKKEEHELYKKLKHKAEKYIFFNLVKYSIVVMLYAQHVFLVMIRE